MILYSILITVLFYLLNLYNSQQFTSPDGQYYLKMGFGEKVPKPYCYRYFLPYLLGNKEAVWKTFSAVSLILCGPALYEYLLLNGLTEQQSLLGCLLFVGLPGLFKCNVILPVLVDSTALLFILLSAICSIKNNICFFVFCYLATITKETSFVFIYILTQNPIALAIGILINVINRLTIVPVKTNLPIEVTQPFKTAKRCHNEKIFDPYVMIFPWGLCLLGLAYSFLQPDWFLILIIVAYAQLFVAVDEIRLYQICAPVVILKTITALYLFEHYMPNNIFNLCLVVLLAFHIWKPYKHNWF